MILRRIVMVILFLLAFLFQGNVSHLLSINGGVPEFLLVLTITCVFQEDSPEIARDGLIAGLVFGLFKDICYGQIVGISPLLYLTAGLLMFYFRRRLNNESVLILGLVTLLSTAIFGMGQWLLCMLFTQSMINLTGVLLSLPGAFFWNMVVSLILFYFAKRKRSRSRFFY